jgi:inner membrane protein involved in colicin E2 resistance
MGVRPATGLAAWWGYAEGNETLVGIVVVIVALAAIVFVTRRWWRR